MTLNKVLFFSMLEHVIMISWSIVSYELNYSIKYSHSLQMYEQLILIKMLAYVMSARDPSVAFPLSILLHLL